MEAKGSLVIGAVVQARLGSSRLPGKVLRPLAGVPLLAHVIERLRRSRRLERIIIATSTAREDAALLDFAKARGVDGFAGSENDVLDRFRGAAAAFGLSHVVRICSDSPLIDWEVIDLAIDEVIRREADYAIPDESVRHAFEGVEVVTAAALDRVAAITDDPVAHEHVTWYIRQHPAEFKVYHVPVPEEFRGEFRTSVDVAADLELMERIYAALYRPGEPPALRDAVAWLRAHPEVHNLNAHVRQKAPAAATRPVLFAVLGDRMDDRLLELCRELAEREHAVIQVATVGDANDDWSAFTARGFRISPLPAPDEIERLVAASRPRVIVVDRRFINPAEAARWRRYGAVVLSLSEGAGAIRSAVAKLE